MLIRRSPRSLAFATSLGLLLAAAGSGCCGGDKTAVEAEPENEYGEVDLRGLENLLDAVQYASEEQKLSLAMAGFAVMADEDRWDVGSCGDAWSAYSRASQETKQTLIAGALDDCRSMCPASRSKKDDVLATIGMMSASKKTQIVVSACDEEGPEPVFTGALEARRGQMELMEFWVFRSAFDETYRRLDAQSDERAKELKGRFEELAERVGKTLVLGLPPLDPDLDIPDTSAQKRPGFYPSVQLSQSGIGVDGAQVVALNDRGHVPGHEAGTPIAALHETLAPMATQIVAEREAQTAAWEEERAPKKQPTGNPEAGEGAKAKGEEGKVGKKDAKLKRAKGTKVKMAKETMDKQIADSAGILADLNTMEADGSLFGVGGPGIGGLIGSSYAAQLSTPPLLTPAASLDGRSVVFQADRNLPFGQVYEVLHTVYQSGFPELKLAGWNEDRGQQTVVDAVLGHVNPEWSSDLDRPPPLFLTIVISDQGFHVMGSAVILAPMDGEAAWKPEQPTIPARNGRYPFDELTDLIVKVKAEYPDEQNIVIGAGNGVSYDTVLGTADAVREHLPYGAERSEHLFPYLGLAKKTDAIAAWKEAREPRNDDGDRSGSSGDGEARVSGGSMILLGALDQSVVKRVIKQHTGQIRYCYQKELKKNPSLSGKVTIKFVIAKDGSVSSARTNTTTMNNPVVENCICQRFMRFKFPQPKGGGIVIVTYPFTFSSR